MNRTVELTFGEWLGDQLAERNLSQVQFAEALGVGQTTVSAWIRGQSPPNRNNARRIADFLGVPRWEVLERAGIPLTYSETLEKERATQPGSAAREPSFGAGGVGVDDEWIVAGSRLTPIQRRAIIELVRAFIDLGTEL